MRALLTLIILFSATSAAPAADLPARKPGLWQLTMTMDKGGGMPPQVIKQCIDAATDKKMNSMSGGGMGREQCSKQDVRQVGGGIVVDSVCKVGPVTNTAHAVISGDFNSAYTVQVDSKQEGGPAIPGMPNGAMKMTIAAKWLGACEAGQRPGDMIMGNGFKMNINEMPTMPGGGPPPGMPRR